MGNRVDFDKLRKKRRRATTARRLIALVVIIALIGGVFALNRVFIETGMTTKLSDLVESFGGSGYPVPVPGGIVRDVKSMGGDLAVLNDTNLYVYNKNGKIVTNLQQMSDQTVLITSADRALTYDVGGKRYAIHSRSKRLLERISDHSIQGADMNERGDYAIISSTAEYVSQVMVYDGKFALMMEWLCSDLITDVSLSAKGNRLAAVCVDTRAGLPYTIVYLLDLSVDSQLMKLEFPGELPLEVAYISDGRFSVLTDKQYRLFTDEGLEDCAYAYGDSELLGLERRGKEALLLLQQDKTRRLVLLDASCVEAGDAELDVRVKDFALGDKQAYVLTDTGITVYNRSLERKDGLERRGIVQIHLLKGSLYYLDREEIAVLG